MATSDYFARIEGRVDRDRLQLSTVAIFGQGAVGSPTAVELANSAVGRLLLIDGKRLDAAHLSRHELGYEDVGENKAEAMARLLRRRIPSVNVEYVPYNVTRRFSNETLDKTLRGCDLIIAATDSREAQRRINRRALALDIPAIFPGVDEEAHRGEIFVSIGRGRTPCYECWDRHRELAASLRSVTRSALTCTGRWR